jgi:hypothetical protein
LQFTPPFLRHFRSRLHGCPAQASTLAATDAVSTGAIYTEPARATARLSSASRLIRSCSVNASSFGEGLTSLCPSRQGGKLPEGRQVTECSLHPIAHPVGVLAQRELRPEGSCCRLSWRQAGQLLVNLFCRATYRRVVPERRFSTDCDSR